MKPSQILRCAAQIIEREELEGLRNNDRLGGCDAIFEALGESFQALGLDDVVLEYFGRVKPRGARPFRWWWGNRKNYYTSDNMNARIIGLCLAAAIAESEGK